MKNKILFLGSLCLVMALGLVFSGCDEVVDNVLPEVALKVQRVDTPKVTTAPKVTDSPIFVISWKAVEGAVDYKVFYQTQIDTESVFSIEELDPITLVGESPDEVVAAVFAKGGVVKDITAANDGAMFEEGTANDWVGIVDFSGLTNAVEKRGIGRIGVMAIPRGVDKDTSIVWSEILDFDKEKVNDILFVMPPVPEE